MAVIVNLNYNCTAKGGDEYDCGTYVVIW